MLSKENVEKIKLWQNTFGGHNSRPAGCCLKGLGEMVELCIAAGAGIQEIVTVVDEELLKAASRNEFTDTYNIEKVAEEVGDVAICLGVLSDFNNIDIDKSVEKKMPVLMARAWEVDSDGVLHRPGRKKT